MIIVARRLGQLGNRLILASHLMAAAREYGLEFANPSFVEYAHLFPSTARDLWCRFPQDTSLSHEPTRRRRELTAKAVYGVAKGLWTCGLRKHPFHVIRISLEQSCDLEGDEFLAAAYGDQHVLAMGWLFRGPRLVEKHAEAIRQYFQIAEPHQQAVDAVVNKIRAESDLVVGVHIRHGDYATFENGIHYYSTSQYASMMHQIVEQLPGKRVAFLVCSNSPFERRAFGNLQVYSGPGHMVEDMYALAATDCIIGPPSTYTGWASFYGRKPLAVIRNAEDQMNVAELLELSARNVA